VLTITSDRKMRRHQEKTVSDPVIHGEPVQSSARRNPLP
jgi:hypothetical protein